VSQFGWARYTGSKFIVEFQLWTRPEVGPGLQRARLPDLLSDAEREELRQRQNLVISRFVRPPRSYIEWLGSASADVESSLSRQFEQVAEPYANGTDIWFRYASEDDVRAWCQFVEEQLTSAVDRFVAGY
jgi:hypothetical protein